MAPGVKQERMKFMEEEFDRRTRPGNISPRTCSIESECQPEAIRRSGQVIQVSSICVSWRAALVCRMRLHASHEETQIHVVRVDNTKKSDRHAVSTRQRGSRHLAP